MLGFLSKFAFMRILESMNCSEPVQDQVSSLVSAFLTALFSVLILRMAPRSDAEGNINLNLNQVMGRWQGYAEIPVAHNEAGEEERSCEIIGKATRFFRDAVRKCCPLTNVPALQQPLLPRAVGP